MMPKKKAVKPKKASSRKAAEKKLKIKKEELEDLKNIKIPIPEHQRRSMPSTEDIFMAALSYLWILFLIPFLKKKKDPFVDFHARQGFMLFVMSMVLFIISLVPAVAYSVAPFLWLLFFLGWLLALLYALAGRMWKIPLIGHVAVRLKI